MAKVIAVIIVCLILISGLIAYDFSRYNSVSVKEVVEAGDYYQYSWQEHGRNL